MKDFLNKEVFVGDTVMMSMNVGYCYSKLVLGIVRIVSNECATIQYTNDWNYPEGRTYERECKSSGDIVKVETCSGII